MDLTIDTHAPEPAYLQLAARLRAGISAMHPRDPIPSIQEIVGQTGLAIGTVQKTLRLLKDEGLIYSVPGRGTFVAGS